MKKKALICYSGGKDSHLALFYAIKRGFEPILFYADAPKSKQGKFFSSYIGKDIIKKHSDMMRLKINSIKVSKNDPAKWLNDITDEVIKKLKTGERLFYFSSGDYQLIPKDEKINQDCIKICKSKKIGFVSFIDIIHEDDILPPIKICLKHKIKSIIIGLEKEIDKSWLLKPIDVNFVNMIKKTLKTGVDIDANSYQSLVVESPLFAGKKLEILDTEYYYYPKEKRHFSIIKKCSIVDR